MNVGNTLKVKRSILSEIVSDARDPFSRKIIIGKGLIQGVKEGMPVIDELGLLGQVTRAFPSRAEVSLITDKEQIIPVENLRNGIRSVAYGGLDGGLIELRFMAANADIENNDLLVTSGLDGVYPRLVQPLVTKISLCAVGIPSKAPVSPAAKRASAALACSRVRSSRISTNAFNLDCWPASRRASWASSVALAFLSSSKVRSVEIL